MGAFENLFGNLLFSVLLGLVHSDTSRKKLHNELSCCLEIKATAPAAFMTLFNYR